MGHLTSNLQQFIYPERYSVLEAKKMAKKYNHRTIEFAGMKVEIVKANEYDDLMISINNGSLYLHFDPTTKSWRRGSVWMNETYYALVEQKMKP
jgi:hypothetical protein